MVSPTWMVGNERVLHGARDAAGARVVATDRGIYRQPAGETDRQRLGWEEIHRVRWVPERRELTIASLVPHVSPGMVLRLAPRSHLPSLVDELVAAATLVTGRVALRCGASAQLSARRRPGTGEVIWVVACERRIDPGDAAVQADIQAAIHDVRVQVGF